MIALLERYSISEILIFIVILALAIKSLISFFDWVQEKFKKTFNKEYKKLSERAEIEQRLNQENALIKALEERQSKTDMILQELNKKINSLIESDKDDIRASITREHHYFCYEKKWIDDFSLDCIEKQFAHYTEEGGNSFIGGFMTELRSLPRQDPDTI